MSTAPGQNAILENPGLVTVQSNTSTPVPIPCVPCTGTGSAGDGGGAAGGDPCGGRENGKAGSPMPEDTPTRSAMPALEPRQLANELIEHKRECGECRPHYGCPAYWLILAVYAAGHAVVIPAPTGGGV